MLSRRSSDVSVTNMRVYEKIFQTIIAIPDIDSSAVQEIQRTLEFVLFREKIIFLAYMHDTLLVFIYCLA